jgi:hypothetical protein
MFHVFWVLLNYTNNINVTIILAERAILLFTEFILMAKNSHISKDLYYIPNVTDAMNFAYKKTIGPINFKNMEKNNFKSNSLVILKLIIQYIYQHIDFATGDLKILEEYHEYITVTISRNHKLLNDNEIFNSIFEKIHHILYNDKTIEESLLKIKILFELLYEKRMLDIIQLNMKITEYCTIMENYQFKSESIDLIKSVKRHELYKCLKLII